MAARCAAESAATIGQVGHDASERQHGLDALAGRHDSLSRHRNGPRARADDPSPAVGVSIGALSSPDGSSQVRCAPVIAAVEVGDCGDHCRPRLGRRISIGTIIAARMEAQAAVPCRAVMPRLHRYDSTIVPAIGCDMANSRRADSGDPIGAGGRRLLRSDGGSVRGRLRKDRASSSTSRQTLQLAIQSDEVEQIAMLAGGGISPFAGGAFPAVRSNEADEQAAAGRVPDVADQPVATPAAAVGEIMAAHGLGITREAARQVGGLRRHIAHAAALSATLAAWGIAFRWSWARHLDSWPAARCTASPSSNMIASAKSGANQ